jgi:uncharacterized protein (DUF305 family)
MSLNEADKKFLKEMVPHHMKAVKMARIVILAGSDTRVNALARKVRDGQSKEIIQMTEWLAEVGEKPNSM